MGETHVRDRERCIHLILHTVYSCSFSAKCLCIHVVVTNPHRRNHMFQFWNIYMIFFFFFLPEWASGLTAYAAFSRPAVSVCILVKLMVKQCRHDSGISEQNRYLISRLIPRGKNGTQHWRNNFFRFLLEDKLLCAAWAPVSSSVRRGER